MTRIALIVDKQEAYVRFERDRILKGWGVEWDETRSIKKIGEAGLSSLFGSPPISVLELDDKSDAKETSELMKKASSGDFARWGTPGLVILTTVDRTSTKTLEKLVREAGGEVVLAKENSKDKTPPAERLVDELAIPRDSKAFLKNFAGDDYSSILSLMKTLGDLTVKQQQRITVEDLMVRLPQAPGAIPPWEIEPALVRGDITKAVELYRRVSKTSSYLVVLAILKNKFNLVFKVASLLSLHEGMTLPKLATALSVPNNYPLKLAYNSAQSWGVKKSLQIIDTIAETEDKVKGGSSADAHVLMETMLVKIAASVRSK